MTERNLCGNVNYRNILSSIIFFKIETHVQIINIVNLQVKLPIARYKVNIVNSKKK